MNPSASNLAPYASGLITLAVVMPDRIIVASDSLSAAELVGISAGESRALELEPGTVVAGAGIWVTVDKAIDTRQSIVATFQHGESAESFIQRFDRLNRQPLQMFLTRRFEAAPDVVLRECFCPLMPPLSLIVGEASAQVQRTTMLEYIPRLTADNRVTLTPLIQQQEPTEMIVCAAIGAAAPYIHLPDPHYVQQALHGPRGPEHAARLLVEEAIGRVPAARRPVVVRSFGIGSAKSRRRRSPPMRVGSTPTPPTSPPTPAFPPVDTKNPVAVEQFVAKRFGAMYPNDQLAWIPRLFSDVTNFFGGNDPDFAPVDLRYHDLEHSLQATVCVTMLLAGHCAARKSPRIDAHHFELAITAALLHDAGYLKLRSDTKGTGAKYTFCHVLRGCAFAASYLPNIGATGADLETVLSAINCTGPANEISRLRFQAPVDEIIGSAVATADFLGQMAAPDYPDELAILFDEFQESDEFLHIPAEQRVFKSAHDLIRRTPDFWHRFVLPKLESDFHGLYHLLAEPYPAGHNAYIESIETNILEIQQRLSPPPQSGAALSTRASELSPPQAS